MDKLLYSLIKGMNFYTLGMLIYKSGGKEALRRFLTPPRGVIEKVPTAKIPGRVNAIIEEREEFTEEAVEFFEACVDEDFVDPD